MQRPGQSMFYVSVGAGMALGTVAFTMVTALFEVVTLPWALVSLALAALLCTAIALSVGELASMWPSAPAIRTYFKIAFGEPVGLSLVFLYIIFIVLIAGVESYLFALVMRAMLPGLPPLLTVLVLIGVVVASNLYGLELPRTLQMMTTYGCLAVIIVTAIAGAVLLTPASGGTQAAGSEMASLPAGVGIAVFLFMGFEWLTTVGLRPEDYKRTIPLSMLLVVAVLLLTYGLFTIGLSAAISRQRIIGEPVPQVAYLVALLGPAGVFVAGGLSSMAIVSTFNAGIMGGARLLQALGRERVLPVWIGTVNLDTGAPTGAVLLLGGLAAMSSVGVVWLDLYLLTALIGSTIVCFIYGAYMLAVIRLRRTHADHRRSFRTPLPLPLQAIMAILMPVVGLSTLLSIPELGMMPAAGFGASVLLAAVMGNWSHRRAAVYTATPSG